MKKKIIIIMLVLAALFFGAYKYLYQDHRNIATEEANYSITVPALVAEFSQNDTITLKKYRDKTISLEGKITSIDKANNLVVIDEKMNAVFKETIPAYLNVNTPIKIKGRFIDYDDLLEEYKMDQVTITN